MSTPDTTSSAVKVERSSSPLSPSRALRRPAPNASASTSKKAKTSTPFDVESILECTICLDFASSPIMNCDNSHILCGQCAPKFKACPTCKLPKISPSPLGEKLAKEANRKIDCVYSESGCNEGVLSTKFMEHLPICNYRDITCAQLNCNDKIPFNKYFGHLSGKHKVGIADARNFTKSYCAAAPGIYPQSIVKFGNLEFIVHAAAAQHVFFSWVSILGSKEIGSKYSCKITLTNQESNSYGCVWALPILPYHEIPTRGFEKLQDYKIFKIPMPSLKDWGTTFQTENGQRVRFYLKYEIISKVL